LRVLHLLKTSVGGRWALRQIRELIRLGVDVHVVLPPGGPLVSDYEAVGAVVHPFDLSLPTRAPWRWPSLFAMLRRLVDQARPDLLHSHFVSTTLTMRLALGKDHPVPRVFQVPGPLHLEYSFYRASEIMTAGPPDRWIGSCRWICERYLASGINASRVFLSYYGYGSDLQSLTPGPPGKLRAEIGLSADTKVVGMVAYMYAPKHYLCQWRGLKGHEDLIDAIAIACQHEPNIVCVIVGGAWGNASAYEARVRAYGASRCGNRVMFLGHRDDISDLYPDMNVAVHPSHSESVGGAAESLLLGVPTIATAVGGLPDVVIDGETGWLVPPRRPDQLASAILAALRDPIRARDVAARGRELARRLLDVKRNAQEILEFYETILSRIDSRERTVVAP
jgi:glycosyltransferase involved in cell wall biosynthesis